MNLNNEFSVFVTGGTGLVGSHVLYELLKRGIRVKALYRAGSKREIVRKVFGYYTDNADELLNQIEWVLGDLMHAADLETALQGVRYVYHSAAMVSYNPADDKEILRINVTGTFNLITQCRKAGVEKFCFVSSSATLGKLTGLGELIDEETPFSFSADITGYARSKYESEQVVWEAIADGMKAVIVNPVTIIGPGDWGRSTTKFIQQVWKGFPFYTNGVNGFVDVRDVARAMIALTESPLHGTHFVLHSESWSFKKLLSHIADELGKRRPYILVYPWVGELIWRLFALQSIFSGREPLTTRTSSRIAFRKYYFSNEKIKRTIGYEFIKVEQSLRDTCRYFLEDVKGHD